MVFDGSSIGENGFTGMRLLDENINYLEIKKGGLSPPFLLGYYFG